jgi:hypothetical protein
MNPVALSECKEDPTGAHIRGANSDSDGCSYHGDHIRAGDSACSASRLAH